MGLLLNGMRDLVTKTIGSAKALNAFFALVFTDKIHLHCRKFWSNENLASQWRRISLGAFQQTRCAQAQEICFWSHTKRCWERWQCHRSWSEKDMWKVRLLYWNYPIKDLSMRRKKQNHREIKNWKTTGNADNVKGQKSPPRNWWAVNKLQTQLWRR